MATETTHIRTSRNFYYGATILGVLVFSYEVFKNKWDFTMTTKSIIGIIAVAAILYSVFKIFFGHGKIILKESEFRVQGYGWTNWGDLTSVYPFIENDNENGNKNYIHFRLTDGTDLRIRSEYLELTFEEIAEVVSQYKANYLNIGNRTE